MVEVLCVWLRYCVYVWGIVCMVEVLCVWLRYCVYG